LETGRCLFLLLLDSGQLMFQTPFETRGGHVNAEGGGVFAQSRTRCF
jgi:hypothetical protein